MLTTKDEKFTFSLMIREMTPCLFSMYQYFQKCFIKNNFTEKKKELKQLQMLENRQNKGEII